MLRMGIDFYMGNILEPLRGIHVLLGLLEALSVASVIKQPFTDKHVLRTHT